MRILLLLLLTGLSAFGQAFTQNDLPFLAQPAPAAAGGGGGGTTPPGFVASFTNTTGGQASCVITSTVSPGANRLMFLSICQGNSPGTPIVPTSVTWAGTATNALTAVTGYSSSDTNFCSVQGFALVAPEVFTNGLVTITYSAGPGISGNIVRIYTNAAQSGTFGTAVIAGSKVNTTSTITCVTGSGQINVASTCTDANGALTNGGTATRSNSVIINGITPANADVGVGSVDATTSGTITWSWSGADNGWAAVTIPINGI